MTGLTTKGRFQFIVKIFVGAMILLVVQLWGLTNKEKIDYSRFLAPLSLLSSVLSPVDAYADEIVPGITGETCLEIYAGGIPGIVALAWTRIEGSERYDIYRATESNPSDFVKIGHTGSWLPVYIDCTVQRGITYLYVVVCIFQETSCHSNVVSVNVPVRPGRYNSPPVIYSIPITDATAGALYSYDVNATDPNGDDITYSLVDSPDGMTIDASSGLIQWTPESSQAGENNVTVRAQDTGELYNTQSFSITVVSQGVQVTISADPENILQGESSTLTWQSENAENVFIDNGVGIVDVNGSVIVYPENTTVYTITVSGELGMASAQTVVTVSGYVEDQPEGSFGEQYEDLIPEDATIESYDSRRFSLITGNVNDINDSPVTDVSITVHGHPEYGTTLTDEIGQFTIPVEGGAAMTVNYSKDGYISAQRQVYVPWNDFAITETILMISQDPASTAFSFDGDADTVVIHQSTEVEDEYGSRACTMVFTGDNAAYLMDEEGNDVYELSNVTVRATEFTVPEAMPAILPSNSAYTYCVELSVDGAQRVRFDDPVITWIDNFLGFDVGEAVPVGYYDRDMSVWVPSDNGVVVKLLDTDSDGVVDALDMDGDDSPDDMDEDGSYDDEVIGLDDPSSYPPDSTFWRVSVTHFSPWDCNWPYGPPSDAIAPNPNGVPDIDQQKEEEKDCPNNNASFVEERSRIFHEDIPIPGTDLTFHYASNRVEGYKTNITVPASGSTVPGSLKEIIVKVEVAGRVYETVLDPLPDQMAEFEWDGLDNNGRMVSSPIKANVNIGFVYGAVYYRAGNFTASFAQAGTSLTAIEARQEFISRKRSGITVYPSTSREKGALAEGWSLSNHHYMNPTDQTKLYKGEGTQISYDAFIIDTVAGIAGSGYYNGDNMPATQATLYRPQHVAVNASGEVYIADTYHYRIRKIDTDGIITTVAGTGTSGYSGDGGLAVNAKIGVVYCLAVNSYGELFITENTRIRKVDTNGIITTIAGTGTAGYSGDGGPAIEAQIYVAMGDIAINNYGEVYFADNSSLIRKIDTNGIITTVAGNGTSGYSGDGGQALNAQICPYGIAINSAGELLIADYVNDCIRKIDTSGIITTVVDDVQARDIAVTSSGEIYFIDAWRMLYKVNASGIITRVAGSYSYGYSGDGGLPTSAKLNYPMGFAMSESSEIYIADTGNYVIRKIAPPSSFLGLLEGDDIPFADDNGLGYIMSSAGLHKKTFDLDTSVVFQEFGYDEDNNLISITDNFGNQIIIERDTDGVPTAIISPDGITTTLTVDTDNHLTRITYPDSAYYEFEYTEDGLLTAKIDPEGNRYEHQFDSGGKLTDATDDEGGHWNYTRTAYENSNIITDVLTGEGNLTSYLDNTDATGAYTSTITDPTGGETFYTESSDGLTVTKALACGMENEIKYNVDSEYKFKVLQEMAETTPSSLSRVTSRNKTYVDNDSDDVPDLITEIISINGKSLSLAHNTLSATKTITSPEGRTVTATYDPTNLLTQSISIPGLSDVNYEYDSRGRLTSAWSGGREILFEYDSQGFLASVTDPEENTTGYFYDAVGRIIEIDRPDASVLGFAYDNNGNMTVFSNPSEIDHTFGYNSVNMNSSYNAPLSGSYQYLYDKDRRLIQTIFPSGDQIDYIYDATQLTQIQTPEKNIDLTYLCSTSVGSITDGSETIEYDYDGKLVTSETLSGTLNRTLSYTYNNDFDVTGLTYAGATQSYSYDDDGLLVSAGDFTITRDADNGLAVALSDSSLSLDREFNGYGEVDYQTVTVSAQSVLSWDIERDNNGRIINKTEDYNGVSSDYVYTYDAFGRLLTVTKDSTLVEEYEYSQNGTRTYEMNSLRGISGRNLTYSDEDHLLTAGATIYQYNLDGYLTTKTNGSDITTFDYSSRGELLSVNLPDGDVITYVHDPLGRRIAKKVNGIITEKYLWQGMTRLLAVYDVNNNLFIRFEYADDRMPVAMVTDGATYYLAYDQVGSLKDVSDAYGNTVKAIDYDSFGNIINDTNPWFLVPFGFAGGLYDSDTGLVRFGYRDYDPDTGRWTAKDPILFAGGDTDLYGYCLNDPVSFTDTWGLLTAGQNFFIGAVGTTVSILACLTPAAPVASALGGLTSGLLTLAMGGDLNEALWNGATAAWGGGLFNWTLKTGIPKIIVGGLIGDYGLDLLWAATSPPWVSDDEPCQ